MVLAQPFPGLTPRTWERVDHLQPRSSGFDRALDEAAVDLHDRLASGRLRPDDQPGGRVLWIGAADGDVVTAGVVLACAVDRAGPDAVLPHEDTFPEPVARRVRTRNRLQAETVPTLLLLRDEVPALSDLLRHRPPATLSLDLDGGQHQAPLPVDRARAIADALRGVPALVADGHHRIAAANAPDALARGSALAWLVAADHPPLLRPVHRVLPMLPADAAARLRTAGVRLVDAEPTPSPAGTVLVLPDGAWLLEGADGEAGAALANRPPAIRDLPVTLAQVALHDVLGLGTTRESVRTTTDPDAAVAQVADGAAASALLACGPTIREVWRAAEQGVRMPPKATWFSPKPASGGVLRDLRPLRDTKAVDDTPTRRQRP